MGLLRLGSLVDYLRRVTPSGDDEDDGQLLARFAAGDELAFAALVHRYAGLVWGVCRRQLPRQQDAEDAFQATFLVLVRKARSLGRGGPLGPWLHQVASRTAVKARVRSARQAGREQAVAIEETSTPDDSAELRELLDQEIGRLPEKYRGPLVLCYLEGLSNDQAADRLGCPRGTIGSRLSRAREQLRRRLQRHGLELPACLPAVAAVPPGVVEAVLRAGPVVRDGACSASVSSLAQGVLIGMSLHKARLVVLAVLVLAILAGAGVWAGRPAGGPRASAQPAEKKVEAKPAPPPAKPADRGKEKESKEEAPPAVDLDAVLNRTFDFAGFDDPKTTLAEVLEHLGRLHRLTIDINEKAFKQDEFVDVLKWEPAGSGALPPMKTRLAAVLKKLLSRVPNTSGAVFLLRGDHIEITTGDAARRELGLPILRRDDKGKGSVDVPLPPLVSDDIRKVPLEKALDRIAEATGLSIVIDTRVEKKAGVEVTARLRNVPVEAAVEVLADMAGLAVVRRNNVLYVTAAENAERLGKRWPSPRQEAKEPAKPSSVPASKK